MVRRRTEAAPSCRYTVQIGELEPGVRPTRHPRLAILVVVAAMLFTGAVPAHRGRGREASGLSSSTSIVKAGLSMVGGSRAPVREASTRLSAPLNGASVTDAGAAPTGAAGAARPEGAGGALPTTTPPTAAVPPRGAPDSSPSSATPSDPPIQSPSDPTATAPSPTVAALPSRLIVAVNGTSAGDGTLAKPLDIATALAGARVAPGDTIWLRGGTYTGNHVAKLSGSADKPITIRPYPGESPVLDGSIRPAVAALRVDGSNLIVRDLEITDNHPDRDAKRATGLNLYGANVKVINNVVHDTSICVAAWSQAVDLLVYGNTLFNCGYRGTDRPHGHGIYAQNDAGRKVFANNVISNTFGYTVHFYTENGSIKNMDLKGNIITGSGALNNTNARNPNILVGGGQPASGFTISANRIYEPVGTEGGGGIKLGYSTPGNTTAAVTDNYVAGRAPLRCLEWADLTITGNTFFSPNPNALVGTTNCKATSWNANVYFGGGFWRPGVSMDFPAWKTDTGYDSASRWALDPADAVFVDRNSYEAGRGTVTVYNWSKAPTVTFDPVAILKPGQAYQIRNAQNYFQAPLVTGTWEGGNLIVPLAGLAPAVPTGSTAPANTAPEFAVLLVLPN